MEIQESSLYREVEAILTNGVLPVNHTWQAEIHVVGLTYPVLKVLSVDFRQDYENAYADETIVVLAVSAGTFLKYIYPYQDQMEITLYRKPLQEASSVDDLTTQTGTERYTVTLIDKGNPLIEHNAPVAIDVVAMDLTNIFEIEFQLVNKALEQMRMMTVGGIWRNVKVQDVVQAVMTNESKKVNVEGVHMPLGVDIIKASNDALRDHVIIPQGTHLVDVPQYVQYKCGGIYSSGIGYYYQNNLWYVYPIYDVTRFNDVQNTLTVINIPKNKLPSVERTYRKDASALLVLATGEVQFRDNTEVMQLNAGNGVRFSDANKFMTGFATTENNKTSIKRGTNNSEFVAVKRVNGNNNVRMSENAINANPFVEYSRLAEVQGSLFSFIWENSDPSLIYPGMPAQVMYMKDGQVKQLFGVVLKAHHMVQLRGQGFTESRYMTRSTLWIFIKPPEEG